MTKQDLVQQAFLNNDKVAVKFDYTDREGDPSFGRIVSVESYDENGFTGLDHGKGFRKFLFKRIKNLRVIKVPLKDNRPELPEVKIGDIFVIKNNFAYGFYLVTNINKKKNYEIRHIGQYQSQARNVQNLESYFGAYNNGLFGQYTHVPFAKALDLLKQ